MEIWANNLTALCTADASREGRKIWVIHGATGLRHESPKNIELRVDIEGMLLEEFLIAFREQRAYEKRALTIKRN